MIDTPRGYYFGNVSGHELRHLVKAEVYEATALCGVQVFRDSLTDVGHDGSKFCPKCVKKLKELGVEWKR
jgi:hypothetical protein